MAYEYRNGYYIVNIDGKTTIAKKIPLFSFFAVIGTARLYTTGQIKVLVFLGASPMEIIKRLKY